MFIIDEDMYISVTRGDIALFTVTAGENGEEYTFQPGSVVRFKVFEKKSCDNVVFQKDFPITEATDSVDILLTEEETKIGDVISKPVDYWYEIELDPYTNPQTIVGYDDNGPKIFKLYPEGRDLGPAEIEEEDIPVVDEELDLTSTRPVQNQAVTKSLVELKEDVDTSVESSSQALSEVAFERTRLNNLINSTTDDADLELIDIRTGHDGTTYVTAGESVRGQIRGVIAAADNISKNVATNRADINSLEQSTSEWFESLSTTVAEHAEQINAFNQKTDDAKEIAEDAKATAEQTATDTETQVKLMLAMTNEASNKATTATETAQKTQEELESIQADMNRISESVASKDMVNSALNIQRCNIASAEMTCGTHIFSIKENSITFSDTEFSRASSDDCEITLADYNNRLVRVVGTLNFETPYILEDDFGIFIGTDGYLDGYDESFGESCSIDIDALVLIKEHLCIRTAGMERGDGVENPKVSGTLRILPYIPESNSSTYVQEESPSNPNENDLWIWDTSVKRYTGSTWKESVVGVTQDLEHRIDLLEGNFADFTSDFYKLESSVGDIETALDNIIEIQNSLIGGDVA